MAKDGIVLLGFVAAVFGLLLRIFAHVLAFPNDGGESRSGAIFVGSHAEKMFIDLGMVSLVFGLAVLLLAMARAPRPRDHA